LKYWLEQIDEVYNMLMDFHVQSMNQSSSPC
jgi:hypothetical protein